MHTDPERKARRYRELARLVMDEPLRIELENLASEYETAARRRAAPPARRLDPAS